MHDDIFIGQRVCSSHNVCGGCIVWCGRHDGRVFGDIGSLMVSQKNENGENMDLLLNNCSHQLQI